MIASDAGSEIAWSEPTFSDQWQGATRSRFGLPGQSASCTTASSASPWPTTRLPHLIKEWLTPVGNIGGRCGARFRVLTKGRRPRKTLVRAHLVRGWLTPVGRIDGRRLTARCGCSDSSRRFTHTNGPDSAGNRPKAPPVCDGSDTDATHGCKGSRVFRTLGEDNPQQCVVASSNPNLSGATTPFT